MNVTNLTLAQLRAATKAQIITAIGNYLTNNFTKRQLILWLWDADVISDDPIIAYRPDGQIESQTEETRDVETGVVVGGRVVTWSYYPSGEVHTIIISQRDALNNEIARKIITHFLDGRRPEVSE